jgi:hypothetical protein
LVSSRPNPLSSRPVESDSTNPSYTMFGEMRSSSF